MDKNNVPKHVAIIMDGNRRWAKKRSLPANFGHKEGYKRFLEIGELCRKQGIKTLTVYALSTENWKRDESEISALMDLMRRGVVDKVDELDKENIRIRIIGRKQDLPKDLQESLTKAEEQTAGNTGADLNIAISYGGRAEIVDAARALVSDEVAVSDITEETLSQRLYTHGQTDPELVIRTGGAVRLSNFLLWQVAYSEIYFTDTLWPDFDQKELEKALDFYHNAKRNFGK